MVWIPASHLFDFEMSDVSLEKRREGKTERETDT